MSGMFVTTTRSETGDDFIQKFDIVASILVLNNESMRRVMFILVVDEAVKTQGKVVAALTQDVSFNTFYDQYNQWR
jgi:hypothetical protein